jgi:hypothetical protein
MNLMEHLLEEHRHVIIKEILRIKNILFSINMIKGYFQNKMKRRTNFIIFLKINQK